MQLLTLIIFLPLLGAAFILFLPRGWAKRDEAARWIALLASGAALLLAIRMFAAYEPKAVGLAFVESYDWIPAIGVKYVLGVDGLSVPMVLLSALLAFLCVIASWKVEKMTTGYLSLFLLLESSMTGVFCAQDLFLFYVFWELMLLPMYFLIGIWGSPSRVDPDGRVRGGPYAAIKFFLYTLVGSVLMLIGIVYLWKSTGTFDMQTISGLGLSGKAPWEGDTLFGARASTVLYLLFFISFAIKVPMFPFHTWLPDAHVEAPTAVSVILAGVLLKLGTYGILRINYPFFPDATVRLAYTVAVFGVINILYGAFCAMSQRDLKRLVAYSSISHMGYVLLGMSALTTFEGKPNGPGILGGVLQMWNHGTITAMLFLLVGVIYDRLHHRDIDRMGGLAIKTPVYSGFVFVAFFASLGLPGLSGFIGEALVLLGTWADPILRPMTYFAAAGIVVTAGYHLWMIQRAFLGTPGEAVAHADEISPREISTLVPLVVIIIAIGVYPVWMLRVLDPTLMRLLEQVLSAAR